MTKIKSYENYLYTQWFRPKQRSLLIESDNGTRALLQLDYGLDAPV